MISLEELATKSKAKIRSNPIFASAFEFYFLERFGVRPSFCCAFTDYGKLFNSKIFTIMTKSKKYKVSYSPGTILTFREGKKVRRTYAKNATDDFLDGFLKNHSKTKFPNVEKKVVLIQKPKKQPKKQIEKEVNNEQKGTE